MKLSFLALLFLKEIKAESPCFKHHAPVKVSAASLVSERTSVVFASQVPCAYAPTMGLPDLLHNVCIHLPGIQVS